MTPNGRHGVSHSTWSVDARKVERTRILRGWSRAQLARTARVDPKTVGGLVKGRHQPNLGTVQALCTALDLSLSDVIVFVDEAEEEGDDSLLKSS